MAGEAELVARWQSVSNSFGAKAGGRLAGSLRVVPRVVGDEPLVYRLSTGPARLAKVFKIMRRRVAQRTIVPITRRRIPRSNRRKRHLRPDFRVRYARLEGTWIAAGDRDLFYGAILNARTSWLLRGLESSEQPYRREYAYALEQFREWMVSGKPMRLR